MLSPIPSLPGQAELRKLGPTLRRNLLQQSQRAIQSPEMLSSELPLISVVIRASQDISQELESQGALIRSVTQNRVFIITADIPPAIILTLIKLRDVETIELAQPIPPAANDKG
jgi:hypothetical protein